MPSASSRRAASTMRSSPVSGSTMRPRRLRARSKIGDRPPFSAPRKMVVCPRFLRRTKAEDLARLGGGGRTAIEAIAVVGDLLHQLGIARGEPVRLDAQVVLEAGAAVAAGF